jgi:hypothetical protein
LIDCLIFSKNGVFGDEKFLPSFFQKAEKAEKA